MEKEQQQNVQCYCSCYSSAAEKPESTEKSAKLIREGYSVFCRISITEWRAATQERRQTIYDEFIIPLAKKEGFKGDDVQIVEGSANAIFFAR